MICVLKIIWDYQVPLLELIIIWRRFATNPLYAIYYSDDKLYAS